eukprot:1624594-Prymnesium_polylepis.1
MQPAATRTRPGRRRAVETDGGRGEEGGGECEQHHSRQRSCCSLWLQCCFPYAKDLSHMLKEHMETTDNHFGSSCRTSISTSAAAVAPHSDVFTVSGRLHISHSCNVLHLMIHPI